MMYREDELTAIREQQKKRWMTALIPCALLLITIIIAFTIRGPKSENDRLAMIIVIVCTILMGGLLIFTWALKIKPLRCYEKHINNLLHGRTHEFDEGTYSHMDSDISLVDGVEYYALYLTTFDEKKKKTYERLFYYDALKPKPEFAEGQPVHVVYHDKEIGLIEAL